MRRRKGDTDCDDFESDDGTRGRECGLENLIKNHSRVNFSVLSEAACRYSQFGSTVHAESRIMCGSQQRIVHRSILVH